MSIMSAPQQGNKFALNECRLVCQLLHSSLQSLQLQLLHALCKVITFAHQVPTAHKVVQVVFCKQMLQCVNLHPHYSDALAL